MPRFPVIRFHQYGGTTAEDELLLFAAPAKDILRWAGIPRKGWNIRMLYQRWITPGREQEVRDFWRTASTPQPGATRPYILGPTALTIAIHEDAPVIDDEIDLSYSTPYLGTLTPTQNMKSLAKLVLDSIRLRLDTQQRDVLDDFCLQPLTDIPDTDHDYVLQSSMQFAQMSYDPQWFIDTNALSERDIRDINEALESMCRPALIVDGQHRLDGASNVSKPVWLPVVAIPNCPWTEQIYQFVVINEKARRVDQSLLSDIFGSSLTKPEQQSLRNDFERVRVEIGPRIDAVIASRDQRSPFYNMIQVRLQGTPPAGISPYISENTVRQLIEGGRGTPGWRSDKEFYTKYVSMTFEEAEWESSNGTWREFWYAFWSEVREFYNEQAIKSSRDKNYILWNSTQQSNLTKGVSLRALQKLFIKQCIRRVDDLKRSYKIVADSLGESEADKVRNDQLSTITIPPSIEEFRAGVRSWFLDKGVPVRFFLRPWKSSLDTSEGFQELVDEMERAFNTIQDGRTYYTKNTAIFSTETSE